MKTTPASRAGWKFGGRLSFTLIGAAASALTTAGCKKPAPSPPPPPTVLVMTVAKKNIGRATTFVGKLDSPQNVEIRARVEAFLDKILFEEGSEVAAGAPLFELDKRPYLEKLAAAQGALAQAKAALSRSAIEVPRLTALVAQKAAPQRELDTAVTTNEANEANVASADARVKSAELDLSYCDIKAPLAGRIGAKEVPVGSLVGKGQPTLLATISQIDPIWCYCAISEVDFLHADQLAREAGVKIAEVPVTLILADGTEHPEPGKWVFVDRTVDATTATVRARAEFPNSRKALRPGMFGRIRLSLPAREGNLVVPERALVELQGRNFLWVVDANNRSMQRAVQVAPNRIGSEVIVLEGLQVGERVVVEGLQKVREGGPVHPTDAPQPPETAPPAAKPTPPAKPAQGEPKPAKG